MRTLPKNKSYRQKLIIATVYDYYFVGSRVRANQVALFIMGKKRGVHLLEEERSDVWAIKDALKDKTYVSGLLTELKHHLITSLQRVSFPVQSKS